MNENKDRMKEYMEQAKEFIKKYKNIEEVPDNKVMQYMFEISGEDKNAIMEFFGVSPDQFSIKNEGEVEVDIMWGRNYSPFKRFKSPQIGIMENADWGYGWTSGGYSDYYHIYMENCELNNENLADLICILKMMQYQYAMMEYEDLAEVYIDDGEGIEYDSKAIDIPEILKRFGVERVNPKGESELGLDIINCEIAETEEEQRRKEEEQRRKEEEQRRKKEEQRRKEEREKNKIEEQKDRMKEYMEQAKEFIKKYKNLEEVPDNEVIKYMLEISAEDKNAIREFFGVYPDQFSIKNEGQADVDITWKENCNPFKMPIFFLDYSYNGSIMENDDWDYEHECEDIIYGGGYESIGMENGELNSENLADLICILKIMQYQYTMMEYEDLADVYIYSEGIKYNSKVIDIPEILRCLGVERVNHENAHSISEIEETILDRRDGKTGQTITEILDGVQGMTKEQEQK